MATDITLNINGDARTVTVDAATPLLWVLRDVLNMTGTKFGCGIAQCGACTVHLDGRAIRSCQMPVSAVGSRAVTTIEAIGKTPAGAKIQKAWLDEEVVQRVIDVEAFDAEDEVEPGEDGGLDIVAADVA